ncbi:MAG: hypothetical protein ACOYBV_01495 [Candidatus Avilachnospira sp.]|jgi:hypothetical protein
MDHQKYYDIDNLRKAKSLLLKEWGELYSIVSRIHKLSDKIAGSGFSTLPSDIVMLLDALDAMPSALSLLNTAYRARTKANLLYKIDGFNLKVTQLDLAETMYVDMTNIIHED